jgi:hypothetical protein
VVVAWVGGGWHGGNVAQKHHQLLNQTMTLQTCLQARSLKQRFVSCSRVKLDACKRVTKSTQIRNGMCDTNFFSRPPAAETNSPKNELVVSGRY